MAGSGSYLISNHNNIYFLLINIVEKPGFLFFLLSNHSHFCPHNLHFCIIWKVQKLFAVNKINFQWKKPFLLLFDFNNIFLSSVLDIINSWSSPWNSFSFFVSVHANIKNHQHIPHKGIFNKTTIFFLRPYGCLPTRLLISFLIRRPLKHEFYIFIWMKPVIWKYWEAERFSLYQAWQVTCFFFWTGVFSDFSDWVFQTSKTVLICGLKASN